MPCLYLHPHLNLVRAFLWVSVAPVVTCSVVCCTVTFCFLICFNPWPMKGGLCPGAIDDGGLTVASGTQWEKADMFE